MLGILAGVIGFVGHRLDHSPKIIKMAMKAELMSIFLQSMQYLELLTTAAADAEKERSTDFQTLPKGTAKLLEREFYTFFASFARSNILVLFFSDFLFIITLIPFYLLYKNNSKKLQNGIKLDRTADSSFPLLAKYQLGFEEFVKNAKKRVWYTFDGKERDELDANEKVSMRSKFLTYLWN